MVAADPFILTVTGLVAVEAAFMVPVSGRCCVVGVSFMLPPAFSHFFIMTAWRRRRRAKSLGRGH